MSAGAAALGRFQSTPLREGRLSSSFYYPLIARVSIHAPARGATFGKSRAADTVTVSIHAPARGATIIDVAVRKAAFVSIHAPARGATRRSGGMSSSLSCFNPRPCARGDLREKPPQAGSQSFNPRPCARGDDLPQLTTAVPSCFNPRPCARGDGQQRRGRTADERFNPRPCARGDEIDRHRDIHQIVSIHAPARGATRLEGTGQGQGRVSIHAPARGATTDADADLLDEALFQSTPLREGRRSCGGISPGLRSFNPRPCARGDCGDPPLFLPLFGFQSTPLREGRPGAPGDRQQQALVSIHAPARGATCRRSS